MPNTPGFDKVNAQAQGALDAEGARLGTSRAGAQSALDALLQGNEAKLRPLEEDYQRASAAPAPEREAAAPKPEAPSGPIVKADDYHQFGLAMLAMAMVGGKVSRGNWLGATTAMNGALKGYIEGNQEVAARHWKEYEAKYKEAVAHDKEADTRFDDILRSKTMTLNEKRTAWQVEAARSGREEAAAAAKVGGWDKMIEHHEARQQALYKTESSQQKVVVQVQAAQDRAAAKAPKGAGLNDDAMEMVYQQVRGGSKTAIRDFTGYNKEAKQKLANYIATRAKEDKLSGADINAAQTALLAETGAARNIATRAVSVQRLEKSVDSLAPKLDAIAKKIAPGGTRAMNKGLNALSRELNDPDLAAYETYVREVAVQFREAMTMPGSNSQMHVGSLHVAEMMLNTDMSYNQVHAVVRAMQDIMSSNAQALNDMRSEVDQSVRSGNQGGAAPRSGKVVHWGDLK